MDIVKKEPEEDFHKELVKKNGLVNTPNLEISQLKQENKNLKCEIEKQNVDIQDLQISNRIQKQISQKLSKDVNETKKKSKKVKTLIYKQHRAEIKSWRLELGDETKEKIKLQEKLKKLSGTDASPLLSFSQPRNLNSSSPNSINSVNFLLIIHGNNM